MKIKLTIFVKCLVFLFFVISVAADAQTDQQDKDEFENQQQTENNKKTKPKKSKKPKVFKPSEEISEDKPVAFPIDI